MEMGERNQPHRRRTDTKNWADLADELEFFIGLHDKLNKKKKKENEMLAALSNSTKPDPSQVKKQLGFVDRRINSLRKRLGIIPGIAQRTPVIPFQNPEVGMDLDGGKFLLEDQANLKDSNMSEFKLETSEEQLAEEVANTMTSEKAEITEFRSGWEESWGRHCGCFPDMTTVSSMQFTHLAPGCRPRHVGTEITLQIFSFKLAEIKGGLKWPLSIYGVIAARDPLDRNRNLLFSCDRRNSQELGEDDPFLRLTGPSRAIVFTEPVDFEVQLKLKGPAKPDDRALITGTWHFTEGRRVVSTLRFKNCFCTAELRLEPVEGTIQATILGVRVVKDGGSWPFEHGVRVVCSPSTRTAVFNDDSDDDDDDLTYESNPPSGEIVLLDSKDGAMNKDSEGHLHLSRQVVSVQSIGKLDVTVQAYSPDGGTAAQGHVSFDAKECQASQAKCLLGNAEVEITVAVSLLVGEKREIAMDGFLKMARHWISSDKEGQHKPNPFYSINWVCSSGSSYFRIS